MNKQELVSSIADKTGWRIADCSLALEAVVASITDALKAGEKVQLIGFGTFEVKTKKGRQGINPKTKETITIAASKVPTFKAGKSYKDQF